jgi:hypothetical protein
MDVNRDGASLIEARDMASPLSNLAPPSLVAATPPSHAATALLQSPSTSSQPPPPAPTSEALSGDSRPLFERATIFRFVRDGYILRSPGLIVSDPSITRFLDLNRRLIAESGCDVSGVCVGATREINGIQIVFGPEIGSGLDRDFLGRA